MPRDAPIRSYRSVDWNDANVATLKAGLTAGDSYGEIAKRIPNCTRSGCIGKASRMGIADRVKPAAPARAPRVPSAGRRLAAPPVARKPNQNAGLSFKTRKFGISGNGAVFTAPEPRAPRAAASESAFAPLTGSTPRVWTERLSGMCCWPVGDEGQGERSCCLEVVARGWCAEHLRRGLAPAGITRRENERIGIVPRRRAA